MYDPGIGRWLTEDPIGLDVDSNLYRYVHNQTTVKKDPSGMLEADDRENAPGNGRLVNVDRILEEYVNEVINQARRDARRRNAGGLYVARFVYHRLGEDERGTGVRPPVLFGWGPSVAQVSRIENWLQQSLNSSENQINQVQFLHSRYRMNVVGRPDGPY